FFFFQAEDGIRDFHVTGVQTCALPICLILVLPDKMSQEKIFNLRAMGAEVVLTRSDVGKGHPEYYQDLGKAIAEEQGAYFINQSGNPDNPLAHERTTAPEIF